MVRDPEGKTREECFFSTNCSFSPKYIAELYTSRWPIEVTFEVTREHLGLETARNWTPKSIKRTVPAIFALYSLVYIWYIKEYQPNNDLKINQEEWYHKDQPTFVDVLATIRGEIWTE